MTPLVNSTCNQCQQGRHDNCPAEIPFITNPGDHCACAADKHMKIPQNKTERPIIKSMLSAIKDEDNHTPDQSEVIEE